MSENQPLHSYEELRDIVTYILLNAQTNGVDRFDKLMEQVALALPKRNRGTQGREYYSPGSATQLHSGDSNVVLEIVWDLFRQGILTLGLNASNPGWPWLRLSRFGEKALQQSPYRFQDSAGFMKRLHAEVTDLSPDAVIYLEEAVAAFYADCLLSTCVLLAIAAEIEFLRLLEVAKSSAAYGNHFSRIGDGLYIRTKMTRFQEALKPALGFLAKSATDGLENNFNVTHSIISMARNESGRSPGSDAPTRDQVYVYLRLFIPFAKQLMRLRHELSEPAYPRLVRAP
ncbi:MAG TPA: hypothetical protein VFE63_18055 [Roseiarcus sp.]|nr:hypothetical protein [Roseiarcus sp.]